MSDVDSGSAYDAERDLEERLKLAGPRHTTRGILFTSVVKVLRELGTDEDSVRGCLLASGEKEFLDFFNYPTSALLRLLSASARTLSASQGGFEQGLRRIAERTAAGYMATPVGRSARLMASGDSRHFMTALQTLYGVVAAYGGPAVTWRGPNSGTLVLECTFMPLAYHEAGAVVIGTTMGLENVRVLARGTGPLSVELDVTWGRGA